MLRLCPGMVFDPSDGEIVSHYLPKLISHDGHVRLDDLGYVFKVCDVYSCKPWLLFEYERRLPFMKGNQRFVLSRRQKIARKNSNGKRPRRTLQSENESGGGYWKSSTGEKPIFDDEGMVIGYVNVLNFYDYKCEKNSRKDGSRTDWIMYEYRLPGHVFQEWVICKIKNTSLPEADAYEDVWLRQLFFEGDRSDQTRKFDEDCRSSNFWELGFEQPSDQIHATKALRQGVLLEPEVTAMVEVNQSRLSAVEQVADKSCNNIVVDNHTPNEVQTQHQHVLKDLTTMDQSVVMNENDAVSDCQPSNHHTDRNMILGTSEAGDKLLEVDYQSWFSELMVDDYVLIPNDIEPDCERVLIDSTMDESSVVMKKKNNPIPDSQSSNNLLELGELPSNNHPSDGNNNMILGTSEAVIVSDTSLEVDYQSWFSELMVDDYIQIPNEVEPDFERVLIDSNMDESSVMMKEKNNPIPDCQSSNNLVELGELPSNNHQSDGNNNMILGTSEAAVVSDKLLEVDYQSWFSELMVDDYIQISNEVEPDCERVLIDSTMDESSVVMKKKKSNPIPDCQPSNNLVELGELPSNNHQSDGNMILAGTSEAAIFDDQRWMSEAEVEEILNCLNADDAGVDDHIHINSK